MTGEASNRWIAPLVFLICFALFYVNAIPLLNDSDVPWHIATGALLLDTHQLPATDPWSFLHQTNPWYILSWLWDILLGIADKLAGPFGVLIFSLALCAGLVAGLTARLVALGIALPAVFFTVLLAAMCMEDFVTARPHLAGYALALVFHALLHRSRTSERFENLLWLPPLMVLWANAHGSFLAGFTVIGAYAIEAFFTKRHDWLKRLVAIGLACGVATLITPYGPDIMLGAMRSLGGSASKYTVEWLPFAFTISPGVSAWLMLLILTSNLRFARIPIADKVLAMGWLLATMFAMRNGAIFILLSAPYLATCLDEATEGLRETRKPSAFMGFMQRRTPCQLWAATVILSALFALGAHALPHENKIISEEKSVKDAVDYALEHYPKTPFLTDYNFGGQVIYLTHATLPSFMDSRAGTAYSEAVMQDYLDFIWLREGWQDKLMAYGVKGMIVEKNTKFAQAYDQGLFHDRWKRVFTGTRANVYVMQADLP